MCCSATAVRPNIAVCWGWRATAALIWRRTRSIDSSEFDSRSRLDRLPRPAVDEPGSGRWLLVDWRQHDVHRGPPNVARVPLASAPPSSPLARAPHVPLSVRLSSPPRAFRSLCAAGRPLWLAVTMQRAKPRAFLPSAARVRWRANAWPTVFALLGRRGCARRHARRSFASVRSFAPSWAAANRRQHAAPLTIQSQLPALSIGLRVSPRECAPFPLSQTLLLVC